MNFKHVNFARREHAAFKLTVLTFMLCTALLCSCKKTASPDAQTTSDTLPPTAYETDEPSPADNAEFFSETRDWLVSSASPTWLESFANAVDYETLFASYCEIGGEQTAAGFGEYIQNNAKPSENWQELFRTEFVKNYDNEIVRIEAVEDRQYQCYVIIDKNEVPYVTVDPLTGNFHG